MQTYLQLEEKINLKNKLDELEKNKLEQLQKNKVNIDNNTNNNTNNTNNINTDYTDNTDNINNIQNDINITTEKKIYINNLNDAELFTIDEIMKVSDFKYYLEIFFGIFIVMLIFISKNLFKASTKFIETDFCSVHTTYDLNVLKDKILNNKILKYLLGDEIIIELKDIF